MNLPQSEELDSQRSVKQLEVDFPEILIAIPEYKSASDGLGACLEASDAAILAQVTKSKENPDSVDLKAANAVNAVLELLSRGKAIALVSKNTILVKSLTHSFSYFYYTTKEKSIQRMLGAIKVMTDIKSFFTTINDEDYTAVTDVIEDFKTSKDKPKMGKEKTKIEGTDALSVSIAEGKAFKLLMVELVERKYKVTKTKIAETAAARGKTASKTNHNVGMYKVVDNDTMEELENPVITEVHITKKGVKKTKTFKPIGNEVLTFKQHALGIYTITVVVPGYAKRVSDVVFKKNESNEFTFPMIIK